MSIDVKDVLQQSGSSPINKAERRRLYEEAKNDSSSTNRNLDRLTKMRKNRKYSRKPGVAKTRAKKTRRRIY